MYSPTPQTSIPDFSNLKSLVDIDVFSRNIIKEEGFFPDAALILLKSIVLYCVKDNVKDISKLSEIINSDVNFIANLLSKNRDTEEGLKIISQRDRASENVIGVLRHFLNVYINDNSSSRI